MCNAAVGELYRRLDLNVNAVNASCRPMYAPPCRSVAKKLVTHDPIYRPLTREWRTNGLLVQYRSHTRSETTKGNHPFRRAWEVSDQPRQSGPQKEFAVVLRNRCGRRECRESDDSIGAPGV